MVTLSSLRLEQSKIPTSWNLAKVLSVDNTSDRDPVSINLITDQFRYQVLCQKRWKRVFTTIITSIITNNIICSEHH